MHTKARVGRIAYLNVLPIYFALEHLFLAKTASTWCGAPRRSSTP